MNWAFNIGYMNGFMGSFYNRYRDFYAPRAYDYNFDLFYKPLFDFFSPSLDLTDYWLMQKRSDSYRFDYSPYYNEERYSFRDNSYDRYNKFFDLTKKSTKTDVKDTKVKKDTSIHRVDGKINKSKGIFLDRTVTSGFGMRKHPLSGKWKKHNGIDLKYYKNQDVFSFTDGTVTFAGQQKDKNGNLIGYGNWIEIEDANGFRHRYAHADKLLVKVGQKVKAGELIMKAGRTGSATGPHVHYETLVNGEQVDPFTVWA